MGQTPFQALYSVTAHSEFSPEQTLQSADEFIEARLQIQRDMADAIKLTQAQMSLYFDANH